MLSNNNEPPHQGLPLRKGQEFLNKQLTEKYAIDNEEWPSPIPLISNIDTKPYPISALPTLIRDAVEEVYAFTQAPLSLIASSALGSLSLSGQALVDVKRAERLQGPTGLYLLTIAESGERKSTCDEFFMQPIREYEAKQAMLMEPMLNDYTAEHDAWLAKIEGVKCQIRKLAGSDKDTNQQEENLKGLERCKPEPPKVPRLIFTDATPEALMWNLAKGWPSSGVISSEAGLVLGSHGMGKESVMRNLAGINQLWDGASITYDRKTTDSFTVSNSRLTVALQTQEATIRNFLDKSGDLARGTGFLARFLIAWPESTQGQRTYKEPPNSWPALSRFNQKISTLLDKSLHISEKEGLTPRLLCFSKDAKEAWIEFYNAIEKDLRPCGNFYDVRDVASKTADNAARIAALFELLMNNESELISLEAVEGASQLAAWHLNESRRFFGELFLPEEVSNIVSLDKWIINHCKQSGTKMISRRELQRNIVPCRLRKSGQLEIPLKELSESNRIKQVEIGRKKIIYLNPALLQDAA